MRWIVRRFIDALEEKLGAVVDGLSRRRTKELKRRQRARSGNGRTWFLPEEAKLVDVVSRCIVPSDDSSVGVEDMDVLGSPALDSLDELVAHSSNRQALYARGLFALDELAVREHRAAFIELAEEEQLKLLRMVDEVRRRWSTPTSFGSKIQNKVSVLYHKWTGLFFIVDLFPLLVRDVFRVFYSSQVAWVWLSYDGPPMPDGYPGFRDRRTEQERVAAK